MQKADHASLSAWIDHANNSVNVLKMMRHCEGYEVIDRKIYNFSILYCLYNNIHWSYKHLSYIQYTMIVCVRFSMQWA